MLPAGGRATRIGSSVTGGGGTDVTAAPATVSSRGKYPSAWRAVFRARPMPTGCTNRCRGDGHRQNARRAGRRRRQIHGRRHAPRRPPSSRPQAPPRAQTPRPNVWAFFAATSYGQALRRCRRNVGRWVAPCFQEDFLRAGGRETPGPGVPAAPAGSKRAGRTGWQEGPTAPAPGRDLLTMAGMSPTMWPCGDSHCVRSRLQRREVAIILKATKGLFR